MSGGKYDTKELSASVDKGSRLNERRTRPHDSLGECNIFPSGSFLKLVPYNP